MSVALAKIDRNQYDLEQTIKNTFLLLDVDLSSVSDNILIKPNMCYYSHPSTGEVTDPNFVSALINVIRTLKKDADISIIESDASAMKCKHVFRILGYDKIATEQNVSLINLCDIESNSRDIVINNKKMSYKISTLFDNPYYLINVPKLKYMKDVKISCALKNMFGCNSVQRKSVYHKNLNEAIVGINKLIHTDLVISDGIIVHGRRTKKMDMIMCGEDPVAFDAAVSYMLGINPKKVQQLEFAFKEGIGDIKYDCIGEDINMFRNEFPRPTREDEFMKILAYLYKVFLSS